MVGINFEDWEQRKLENITLKIGSGKTPKGGSTVYVESGIPLLRSQNIHSNKVNFDDVVYITEDINKQMLNSSVLKDDVLLNITGASIGRSAVYTADIPANVNQHVCIIRPNQEGNSFFIQLNIVSTKGQKEIDLNQAGGGREGLNFQQISKMTFSYPSIEEQMQIGSFFKQLDETIALHQRKLMNLGLLKKSFLRLMFPQKDEKVPRLRFANFSLNWEQHKLISIAEIYNNLRIPVTTSDRVSGATPYYGANGIQDYVDGHTHNGEYVLIAEDGANDLINYPVNYVKGKIWVNNHAHVVSGNKNELDNLFLTSRIKSMNISPWLVGGSRAKLNSNILKKILITIPNFNEQQKVGSFFKQLEDTIVLHHDKVEKLKQLKEVYLQKLFV